MKSMITPGTLLINKDDPTTWWLLVSYNVVKDCVNSVAWFNVTDGHVVNLARTSASSLTRSALGQRYTIIEP